MANRVDGSGSSWWSCFCCCKENQSVSPTERDPLMQPTDTEQGERTQRRGSPQASYSSYQTQQGVDGSPMK